MSIDSIFTQNPNFNTSNKLKGNCRQWFSQNQITFGSFEISGDVFIFSRYTAAHPPQTIPPTTGDAATKPAVIACCRRSDQKSRRSGLFQFQRLFSYLLSLRLIYAWVRLTCNFISACNNNRVVSVRGEGVYNQ